MKILGAHQPNYLPWIGYFDKLAKVDCFVMADDVQYTHQSYINRVQIKTAQGRQWLSVPVLTSGHGPQSIWEVQVDNSRNWRKKHWKTLRVNYANAPYFDNYADFFDGFYRQEWQFLVDINIALIEYLCGCFGITTEKHRSQDLNLQLTTSTGRIIDMVRRVDCDHYISGRGASLEYLDAQQFNAAGIGLLFNDFGHPRYQQLFGEFISHLSAVDLLFNSGPNSRELFQQAIYETELL